MPINNSPYLSFLPVTLSSSQNRVQVVSKKKIGSATALAGAVEAAKQNLIVPLLVGPAEIRHRICKASAWLGVELDVGANTNHGSLISTAKSKVSVWVIPTNEELMIARHTGSQLDWPRPRRE